MGIEKNADKVEMARITNASVKHLNVMICDDEKEHVLHLQQLLEQLQDEAMRRNLIKRKMLFAVYTIMAGLTMSACIKSENAQSTESDQTAVEAESLTLDDVINAPATDEQYFTYIGKNL